MAITAESYEQLALEDPDGHWELECGVLRQKPGMTFDHNRGMRRLAADLITQLDRREFEVAMDSSRNHVSTGSFYIPDLVVIPVALVERGKQTGRRLEVYNEPLPLVVEIWSPSTGAYDVGRKLREYQRRGDAEIWRLHPYERTLTAWRLQPDGSYSETVYRGGTVEPLALPGVRIDLDALFA